MNLKFLLYVCLIMYVYKFVQIMKGRFMTKWQCLSFLQTKNIYCKNQGPNSSHHAFPATFCLRSNLPRDGFHWQDAYKVFTLISSFPIVSRDSNRLGDSMVIRPNQEVMESHSLHFSCLVFQLRGFPLQILVWRLCARKPRCRYPCSCD